MTFDVCTYNMGAGALHHYVACLQQVNPSASDSALQHESAEQETARLLVSHAEVYCFQDVLRTRKDQNPHENPLIEKLRRRQYAIKTSLEEPLMNGQVCRTHAAIAIDSIRFKNIQYKSRSIHFVIATAVDSETGRKVAFASFHQDQDEGNGRYLFNVELSKLDRDTTQIIGISDDNYEVGRTKPEKYKEFRSKLLTNYLNNTNDDYLWFSATVKKITSLWERFKAIFVKTFINYRVMPLDSLNSLLDKDIKEEAARSARSLLESEDEAPKASAPQWDPTKNASVHRPVFIAVYPMWDDAKISDLWKFIKEAVHSAIGRA